MSEPKNIHCPKCGTKVGVYDGKSSINVVTRCKKCNKRVVYYVETGETVVKPIPPRSTSSGMTY
jgi:hypothetical protein